MSFADLFPYLAFAMSFPELFAYLSKNLLTPSINPEGKLTIKGDPSKLTPSIRKSLRDHKQAFIDLLSPSPTITPKRSLGISGRVRLGNESFGFGVWGLCERLLSPIAIDTETELIEGQEVPKIALASVSDGKTHRLIKPSDLQAFVDAHSACHFVCRNASFDFAVIRQALTDPSPWIDVADQGRLHDTMFLDALIRLGRNDDEPVNRSLGVLAKAFLRWEIDKEDPYRLRYAELIGQDWDQAEEGFFSYAIKDAIATHKLWRTLSAIASRLASPFADEVLRDCRDRFGLLTESLQVRGAIALDQITRNGLRLDRQQVESTKRRLADEVDRLVAEIEPIAAGVFKRKKDGTLQVTASRSPSVDQKRLIEILEGIAVELDLTPPRTPKDRLKTSIKYWNQFAEASPFLSLWGQLQEVTKLSQFFAGLGEDRIFPRYTAMVRTGRTSCRSPNVQQLPRSGGFREMIVPSPGHYLFAIDYSAVELRTLAAVCRRRYGSSKLADVIRQGIDPHAFTAAMFEGVSIDAFGKLDNRKTLRQRAKALNFGIPGGLGAKSLVAYAAGTYGVKLTEDEAADFRDKLIGEVYPELGEYLKEDAVAILASNLKTDTFRVSTGLDSPGVLGAAKRIVAGKGKASGEPYGKGFCDRVWRTLEALNQNPSLSQPLKDREASDRLSRQLFFTPVCSITGRIRGSVGFSQARNTPFQAIAADGAKLALWRLYREGFRCVAFIHDEVLIELPKDADHTTEAKKIDSILCEEMESLTGDVPIACEYSLADRWYKQSEKVLSAGRLICWDSSMELKH